ncbi:alpha-amylase family glycosyl hydrolase [Pelagicoccus mobilis]|uniref:Glycosyl hydrolase family 13 catalytic domain-containing protein n=1 Tax=Pelagicoccus mobilis TaxID=415221 RepID=A0A934RYJ6_9BACT|nr:alpha-amylase family glycosyl hydrolase [Pelagicoccus mobilis]MBK1878713.1 hypothetical protein [Pelagicoccus mobilis]
MKIFLKGLLAVLIVDAASAQTAFEDPPAWAKEVVWYQIFAERFRNGDPTNDPTAEDIEVGYPGFVPEGWAVTPWGQEWYKPDSWFANAKGRVDMAGDRMDYFGQIQRLRRYGGDLQGVLDKLDYLQDLGVTAIYFNPLNDAPSYHKYDARYWRHIDRNFGPDPKGDVEIMNRERGDDPDTWEFTSADRMFLEVIRQCHERGMKVVLDYSWNHTGNDFWAWNDLVEKQLDSEFADWYWVKKWDDPKTPANEFEYAGWFGVRDLPEVRETEYVDHSHGFEFYEGDLYSPAVKEHIFEVTRRWLDPNGDGDPSDGVDGFRLDVCAELPLGFWREYRKVVRDVNADALLIGETWWELYPDTMMDPEPQLRGDVFDSVMNYRWYRSVRDLMKNHPDDNFTVSEFVALQQGFIGNLREGNAYAMMNLTASHDTPRFMTSIFNKKNRNKVDVGPTETNDYKIHAPDAEAFETAKLLLMQQFTYIGAPHIYMGDEMGMWSADYIRRPVVWEDIEYETERIHPFGRERTVDPVAVNAEWRELYRQLAQFRNENSVLATGGIEYVLVDDERELLAYKRFDETDEIWVAFNLSERSQEIVLSVKADSMYFDPLNDRSYESDSRGSLRLELTPRTAIVLAPKG